MGKEGCFEGSTQRLRLDGLRHGNAKEGYVGLGRIAELSFDFLRRHDKRRGLGKEGHAAQMARLFGFP